MGWAAGGRAHGAGTVPRAGGGGKHARRRSRAVARALYLCAARRAPCARPHARPTSSPAAYACAFTPFGRVCRTANRASDWPARLRFVQVPRLFAVEKVILILRMCGKAPIMSTHRRPPRRARAPARRAPAAAFPPFRLFLRSALSSRGRVDACGHPCRHESMRAAILVVTMRPPPRGAARRLGRRARAAAPRSRRSPRRAARRGSASPRPRAGCHTAAPRGWAGSARQRPPG